MGNDGVATVEKVLALLDCSKPEVGALSLATPAQASGMHKTMVYRPTNSLGHMSYVTRSKSGAYSLGPCLLYPDELYEQSFHLSSVVEPVLHTLAAVTRENASYYIIDHGRRLCLFRAEPSEGLRETWLPGISLPLDDTTANHVLRYWGLGEALYDDTPELLPFTSGARDQHTAVFATSVFGSGDKFIAALTLPGAASRLEAACTTGDFVAKQLQTAPELPHKLGASTALYERLYGV